MKNIVEKDLVLISKFKVSSAETDMEARLSLGALVNLLIQSATRSAYNLGFGFDNLRKHNLFWVFNRLTMEIFKPVKWNEKITIETWPKDIVGLLYTRDFIVRDEKDNIIVKATTAWLPIDLETKRPKRKESFESDFFTYLKDKNAIEEPPEKLPETKDGDLFEVRSTFFDIDFNKHVTSTRYVDWMMDTFPIDFHRDNYPKGLSINYLKETMPGEKIRIVRNMNKGKEYCFEGLNLNNSKRAFRGRISF
ncbi:MAG: acyl-ACP thioesterase domain-containing protein [Acidobacteriota bacterium]